MKRALVIVIILFCAVLVGTGVIWYVKNKPTMVTQDIVPQSELSLTSTTTSGQITSMTTATPDTRSWSERFRDTTIPVIQGVVWKTYTNKEYGFHMEYPMGVQESKNELSKGIGLKFDRLSAPEDPLLGMSVFRGELMKELVQRDAGWIARIKKYGLVPDAKINDVSLYIQYPDQASNEIAFSAIFEKDGNIYDIYAGSNDFNEVDRSIIEYMVKTLHFFTPQ